MKNLNSKKINPGFFNSLLLAGLLLFVSMLITGCSKKDEIKAISSGPAASDIITPSFSANQLLFNNKMQISFAQQGMQNITEEFNGLTFYFIKSAAGMYNGEALISNDLFTVYGKWQTGISKDTSAETITFILPTAVHTQLGFLNNEWLIRANGTEIIRLVSATGNGNEIDLVPAGD